MKKIIFFIACMILIVPAACSQGLNDMFEETTHDFGQITEKGGKVTHNFIFTNAKNEPITITTVKASCGCTTPEWTKTPIEPGRTGTVSATYNPSGRPGKFNKSITVTFADGGQARLAIKGDVIREINIETDYPVIMGNLRLKSDQLNFGNITYGKTKTISLDVYNNTASDVTPQFKNLPAHITASVTVVPPKSAGRINFTFDAAKLKKYGRTKGSFSLTGASNTVNYNANIIDDFAGLSTDQRSNAGKLSLGSVSLSVAKSNPTATLKVSNTGKSDLIIRAIQSDNADIEISKSSFTIKPGGTMEVKVKYPAGKIKAANMSDIWVYSNDPTSPAKVVKLRTEL